MRLEKKKKTHQFCITHAHIVFIMMSFKSNRMSTKCSSIIVEFEKIKNVSTIFSKIVQTYTIFTLYTQKYSV